MPFHNESWFKEYFNLPGGEPSPTSIQKNFSVSYDDEERATLHVGRKGVQSKSFQVGKFTTPSCDELRERLASDAVDTPRAKFFNVSGNISSMHSRSSIVSPGKVNCVIQAASQLNCLEMVGPRVTPDDGVTGYFRDRTQGPACALACPAGTVYRNYFVKTTDSSGSHFVGQCRGGRQINLVRDIEEIVGNDTHNYWDVQNGYLIPKKGKMAMLNQALEEGGDAMSDRIVGSVRAGVHWGTETLNGGLICQVYASAVPVSYCGDTSTKDWAPFARLILRGMYKTTLLAGASIARESGERVTVYLTLLGGGAFGNQMTWILDAIQESVYKVKGENLDIKLVHYSSVTKRFEEFAKEINRHLKKN